MKHKLVCILLRNPGKGIFCLLGLVSGLGAFGFILGFLLGYLVDEILHEKLILTFMMAFILSPDKKNTTKSASFPTSGFGPRRYRL